MATLVSQPHATALITPIGTSEFVVPTAAAQENIPEAIKVKIPLYQERLQTLKARGYSLKAIPGISCDIKGELAEKLCSRLSDEWQNLSKDDNSGQDQNHTRKHRAYLAKDPLSSLGFSFSNALEKPMELAAIKPEDQNKPEAIAAISPYLVKASDKGDKIEISIYDYLNPKAPLIVSATGDGVAVVDEALERLDTYDKKNILAHDVALSLLQANKGQSAFDLYPKQEMSDQQKLAVDNLFDRYKVCISAEKRNGEIDQPGKDVTFLSSDWNKSGKVPLKVNSPVSRIILERELTKKELAALPADQDNEKPQKTVDQYGNTVVHYLMGDLKKETDPKLQFASEFTIVLPPAIPTQNDKEAKNPVPLNFDATAFGGPKIEGYIYRTPEAPIK